MLCFEIDGFPSVCRILRVREAAALKQQGAIEPRGMFLVML